MSLATDAAGAQTAELSAAAYVTLGMIGLGRRSGYRIKQTVERSIRFFWTISPVQIYPSLGQLEELGLVTGRDEPRGRRPRRVYEITGAGRAALRAWLRRPEPMPFELRDIGMVKLFFADALPAGDARSLLRAVTRRSEQRLAELAAAEEEAEEAAAAGDVYPLLTLRLGLGYHRAMVDVTRDFERQYLA